VTRIRVAVAAGSVFLGLLAVGPAGAYQRPGHYTQVDVGNDGKAANGSSPELSIDASGRYVAFSSTASNLGGGSVPQSNIYVRDLVARRTTLVSRGMNGQPATPSAVSACPNPGGGGLGSGLGSVNPAISATGRYVAFASTDVNIVRDVTNAPSNIYVFDLASGVMRLASISTSGALANGWSCSPSVSADGRRVAFVSSATNLVDNDTGGLGIFVHDFGTGKTVRADVSSSGEQPIDACAVAPVAGLLDTCARQRPSASISNDGRYVVFNSFAPNLVSGDTNGQGDVFEHDLKTGSTVRVSVATGGAQATTPPTVQDSLAADDVGSFLTNSWCAWERHRNVSADGRYVLFLSRASNLVPGDTNANPVGAGVGIDVFVRDVRADRTYRVDVSSAGVQNGVTGGIGYWTVGCDISMSADGRHVSLTSTGGFQVYDRATGTASVFPNGIGLDAALTTGHSGIAVVDISADGRYVAAFMANMATHATTFDGFVWDRGKALATNELARGTAPTGAAPPPDGCSGTQIGSTCLPPGAVLESNRLDQSAACGALADPGLRAASIAYRPWSGDVFVRLSLAPGSVERARLTATVFGIDVNVGTRRYEVRADGTSFALYDGPGATATRLGPVTGGFGTTGEEVVFALPMHMIGSGSPGKTGVVTGFAAAGTTATGPACLIDRVVLG